MSSASKPILLLGSYGRGNIGDDAFLAAAIKHFPESSALYVNSAYDELLPRVARDRTQTLATTSKHDLRKKVKAFRGIKHVVYCGGDLWVEVYGTAYPRRPLYEMIAMNFMARVSGKRVYYLGCGVGVWPPWKPAHFFSFAARMSFTEAPEACICIASRATSRQTAQVMPCGSHCVTSPLASRPLTKQSSLPRWPVRSQPQ